MTTCTYSDADAAPPTRTGDRRGRGSRVLDARYVLTDTNGGRGRLGGLVQVGWRNSAN